MTQNVGTKSAFTPFFLRITVDFFNEENAHSNWEFGNTELQTIKMLTFDFSEVHGNILS